MAAPIANTFWQNRHTHGRRRRFQNGAALWMACCDYYEWAQDNPIEVPRVAICAGRVFPYTACHPRPFTVNGLCRFLGISRRSFASYGKRPDTADAWERARLVMWQQRFELAAVGLLPFRLVAHELTRPAPTARILVTVERTPLGCPASEAPRTHTKAA